jgi:hypothetical protein
MKREKLAGELIAGLGRVPTAIDLVAAVNLAALFVRADQLEAAGRNADEIRRQINQAIRATGLRPAKAEPPPRKTFVEKLAEREAAQRATREGVE